ncbi:MAG: DUF805 domain-containing protein [Pseudomonadota bacterium]
MGAIFNFLFNPIGRISRSDYWLKFWLPSMGVAVVAALIDLAINPSLFDPSAGTSAFANQGPVSNLVSLFYLFPAYVAVPVKRLHDRGLSGWWQLLFVAGFIIGLAMIIGGVFAGLERDPNPLLLSVVAGGTLIILAVGVTQLILFGCLPGQKGPNRYGPDPLNPDSGTAEVFT